MTDFENLVAALRDDLGDRSDWEAAGVTDGSVLIIDNLTGQQLVHRWGVPPALSEVQPGWLVCPACGRKVEIEGRSRRFCTGASATGQTTHPPTEMSR